ncbi:AMP-binding protein [Comamonas thiooxydans]|uniref:AMP-binding protein n=2 Tax=Comamonas thiooxydans TaxID=363952 RepID=A0AA42TPE8_9BURK|nr:AMP-binding protein [Comamonas thiooxydans]MDH1334847.1 AMP-binding protein [Comamonas thiooxydans]MDH1741071.1 AMP-binding protein [Comamonas thiooxydans]MDH1787193.1 AMP-binding protein [Comamonas thiooxydans]
MTRTFNLADIFELVVQAVPDRIAFGCGRQKLSFKQLDERANQLGNALRARGIGRGDNVGIQLYNCAEYLEAFFACSKIGAVPVNVNYRYVADELQGLFNSLDLRGLVYGADFDASVLEVIALVPTLRLALRVGEERHGLPRTVQSYERVLAEGGRELTDAERSDDDIFMLCTGGTTGLPKGVMWPHKSLFMGALGGGGYYFRRPPIERPEELLQLVPNGPALAYLAAAPLMHGAAMWATLISLFSGHPVYVNDRKNFDPVHMLDLIEHHQINVMAVVGDAMALPIIQTLENNPGRWPLKSLMIFGNGGAVFSRHLQERLLVQVPHLMLNNGMASSESGVLGGGEKTPEGEGFMRIAPRPDLSVISEDLRILTQPGEEGILSRRGHMPLGYYGDPRKTAETFVMVEGSRWVLTGDRARIDTTGEYVVLGRGSQCINTGGEKVYPEEVEETARRYPPVQDVVVVGLPDERWGSKVVAVVQVQQGHEFDLQEFEKICRSNLSGYKLPRAVYLATEVKRSPAGKADYRWAKAYAAEHEPLSAIEA